MKKFILLALFLISPAMAATDFQCVNDCTSKGYMYNYCTDRCSYSTGYDQPQQTRQPQRIKQTDYKCLSDCTARGYMYNYCQQQCSYD